MTRAEQETVIVANLGDMDEGFFTVETTEPHIYRRLVRMVGDDLITQTNQDKQGRVTTYLCRVPTRFWKGLGVARTRKSSGASSANLAKARAARTRIDSSTKNV
jgi:hypothetical protein